MLRCYIRCDALQLLLLAKKQTGVCLEAAVYNTLCVGLQASRHKRCTQGSVGEGGGWRVSKLGRNGEGVAVPSSRNSLCCIVLLITWSLFDLCAAATLLHQQTLFVAPMGVVFLGQRGHRVISCLSFPHVQSVAHEGNRHADRSSSMAWLLDDSLHPRCSVMISLHRPNQPRLPAFRAIPRICYHSTHGTKSQVFTLHTPLFTLLPSSLFPLGLSPPVCRTRQRHFHGRFL